MIIFGTHLLAALVAGFLFWLVAWVCGRISAPAWLSATLSGAVLVYAFWFFTTIGPVQVGH